MKILLKVKANFGPKLIEVDSLPHRGEILFNKYFVLEVRPPSSTGTRRGLPVVTVVPRLADKG